MKENVKFSVVMPIYNVEKYLEAAIESVLNQSYKNFEVILVDDCSTDSCGAICDRYGDAYKNVKVIHHESNQGLSGARNTGLGVASGDFVFFMDSDDVIDESLFESVGASLEKNSAQVVLFGLIEDYYDENGVLKKSVPVSFGEERLISDVDGVHKVAIALEEKTLYGYAWNKFYDLKYLRDMSLEFEKITLIEDITFNVKVFQNLTSLNILDITPYHYMRRLEGGSLTSKFISDYFLLQRERIDSIYKQYEAWGCCDSGVKKILGNILLRYIFSALERNCHPESQMNFISRYKWLKGLFKDDLFLALVDFVDCEGLILKVMSFALTHKLSLMCLAIGRFIYIVKNKLPNWFTILRQNR